ARQRSALRGCTNEKERAYAQDDSAAPRLTHSDEAAQRVLHFLVLEQLADLRAFLPEAVEFGGQLRLAAGERFQALGGFQEFLGDGAKRAQRLGQVAFHRTRRGRRGRRGGDQVLDELAARVGQCVTEGARTTHDADNQVAAHQGREDAADLITVQ